VQRQTYKHYLSSILVMISAYQLSFFKSKPKMMWSAKQKH